MMSSVVGPRRKEIALPIQVQSHVRSVIDADGAVLLDLKRGTYYSLNGVGADIWVKLESGLTLPEIAVHLSGIYDESIETVRGDVSHFVDALSQKGLVHVAG